VAEPAVRIRPEAPADRAGVRAVNLAAFPTPAEADVVAALRARTPGRSSRWCRL
jgi:predicted N-acetyltransferase YhbS